MTVYHPESNVISDGFYLPKSAGISLPLTDGRIAGFSTSWTNEKDGETSYSSFSYYGDNEATVKRLAREFGINV